MKVQGRRQSRNIQDRRASGGAMMLGGAGIVIAIIFTLITGDPSHLFNAAVNQNVNQEFVETAEEKRMAEYVGVVLADTEDVWNHVFKQYGRQYKEPSLILFKNQVNSGCGMATSAVGPFYCPADYNIYIDLVFHQELRDRFQAKGDFGMAYVIAHEVGHHVQNLLGISDEVHALRGRLNETEYNKVLKRLELQADYLAGVWTHYQEANNLLDINDIREAMEAAAAVGDDRIQESTMGYVVPDKFTHGTSEQRMRWFYKGYQSGNLEDGNTFEISESDL